MVEFTGTKTGYEPVSTAAPENVAEEVPMVDLLRRSSSESQTSDIFEDIDQFNGKNTANNRQSDNFEENPQFQIVFANYKGKGPIPKLYWIIFGSFLFLLWLIAIIVYSNGKVAHVASNLTWKTNVTFAGHNITLNDYSPKYTNISLEHYRKGLYFPMSAPVSWLNIKQYPVDSKSGGYYLTGANLKLVVKQLNTQYNRVLLTTTQFSYKNEFFYIQDIKLNPAIAIDNDRNYHIVMTNIVPQWRHLSFAIYWLYNTETLAFTPIEPPQKPTKPLGAETITKLDFAEFSPNGNYIVFGVDNDLYVENVQTSEVHRITETGSANILNGRTDWVYEEEVLEDSKMFWWSPDEKYLMFAVLNDTNVQNFDVEYYMKDPNQIDKGEDDFNLYPKKTTIKYPKPGTPIPAVTLHRFTMEDKSVTMVPVEEDEFILYDGVWMDTNSFLVKITDRTSRVLSKLVYQPEASKEFVRVNQINATKEFNGWIDNQTPITLIPGERGVAYVDKVVVNGQTHLGLFDGSLSTNYSILLTQGDWNIRLDSKVIYDRNQNFLYAFATIRSSMDSHLIGIDLEKGTIYNITSPEIDGFYDGQFSEDGQYVDLHYKGPLQPWQRLVNMADIHDQIQSEEGENHKSFDALILQNSAINNFEITANNLKNTNIPTKAYLQIRVGKYKDKSTINLNVLQILPPNFNPESRKYPLLVYVYGGPGSQTVDKHFNIDFQDIASASLDAIVLIIDPRGTGGQGWKFRGFATDNIGYWEPRDITTVTSEYISKNSHIIDQDKVGIWGWSYGGFTTLKTLEFDKGATFKFGVAVAPVTNWLFYDSIYTERYFNQPKHNEKYNSNGKITNYDNFKDIKRFMILHGTSDDNVHLQNLMWLLDKFNIHNVENYDIHLFPDSDHSIQFHNAHSVVYDKILNWLKDGFTGKFEALYRL